MNNGETTNGLADGFNAWADGISKMDDTDASRAIFNHMMTNGNMDDASKRLFSASYEYCIRLIREGRPMDPNKLKIHLSEVKGYDVSQASLFNIVMLLGCCGICFSRCR